MGPLSRMQDRTCKSFGSLIVTDNHWWSFPIRGKEKRKPTTDWYSKDVVENEWTDKYSSCFSFKSKEQNFQSDRYSETMWYDWKCTLTSPPLSQMSLTCQGRPGELYPLLHEAQPSNSCWQSCWSATHPLTWWTNTRMVWNIVMSVIRNLDSEWRLLLKYYMELDFVESQKDPILSWTWT